ncbi:MAG TPA: GAF domain-containing protein [Ardenticatenaceae bacterium]|nr:GAF domain-containing protein [Ardenticatenaceae bacterium]
MSEQLRIGARAASSRPTPPELTATLDRILALACAAIPCDTAAIHLLDGERLVVKAAYARPGLPSNEDLIEQELPLDAGFCSHVVRTGEMFRSDDVASERRVRASRLAGVGTNRLIRSFLGVPLKLDGRVIGALELDSHQPGFFDEQASRLAEVAADQAALAIQNARLYAETAQLERQLQAQNKALRAATQRLSALLDAADSGILMLDDEERVLQVNRAYCEMFGVEREAIVGRPVRAIAPLVKQRFADPERFEQRLGWLYDHPHVVSRDHLEMAGPDERHLERYAAPVYAADSRIAGRIEIVTDVTGSMQLEQHIRRYVEQLVLIQRAAIALAGEHDPDHALELVVEQAARLTGSHDAVAGLFDDDGETITIRSAAGLAAPETLIGRRLPVAGSAAGRTLGGRRGLVVTDLASDPWWPSLQAAGANGGSALMVPLLVRARPIGLLVVLAPGGMPFKDHHLQILSIFGPQAGVLIDNARLLHEARDQQQELAALKEFSDLLVESIPTGVALFDREGCFTRVNPAFCQIVGQPAEALDGRALTDVFPQLRETGVPALLGRVWEQRESISLTSFAFPGLAHGEAWFDLTLVPVAGQSGELVAVMVALSDITHIRENERLKDQLISIMGHELRTPLTSILGYSTLLVDRQDAPSERRAKWAGFILDKSRLLNRLIDDVLDLSRLNTRRFDLQLAPLGLEALVRRVAEEFALQAERHQIEVHVSGELGPIEADAHRVEQVLTNVIGNAVKYSAAGGPIRIDLEGSEAQVHLTISDQGVGIAPEHLGYIFEPFYRVDTSMTRSVYGTGLGLTISRGIVEAHGGTIEVNSSLGEGTSVHIRLPRR